MKKFLRNVICFVLLGLLIGEAITRQFALTSNIPKRIVDENGIQKYKPSQKGKWLGGDHSWQINQRGWPGALPESYNNLVTLVGDSFIENFMNPDECHQGKYLSDLMPEFNYLQAARSGVSFIETMEITRSLESLKPKLQIIYVHNSDFTESIIQINRFTDRTQIDLDDFTVIPGKLKSPGLKNILYNWKFMYYLYNRFPIDLNWPNSIQKEEATTVKQRPKDNYHLYERLMDYVGENYTTRDKILVFAPNSNDKLISLAKKNGFVVLHLDDSDGENWNFDYDPHWNCYGHKRVAEQVATILRIF